jgi:hypothetical protein
VSENTDLQIDNIRIGFGDENPEPAPERTPVDRTEELVAVLEALADYLDGFTWIEPDGRYARETPPDMDELVAGISQVLELTQVLYAEHMQLLQQMNEFVGAMALAKQEATAATKLVVANAGDMKRLIKGD